MPAGLITLPPGASGVVPLFLDSDFAAWAAANPDNIQVIGSLYTVVNASVSDVLRGVGSFTQLNHSGSGIAIGKTVNDMGKTIRVGSTSQSEYVVFRRIQVPGVLADEGGNGAVGYVVTDNNCDDLTRPRFQAFVARA